MARKEHPTDPLFFEAEDDDLSTQRHRVVIGVLGAGLPVLVAGIGWLRPVDPTLTAPLSSISAYYYSGAVAVFAGILACLAVYFLTYGGYDNPDRWKDRLAALTAAAAAICVAMFPTDAPSRALALPWWTKGLGIVHYVSAGALFGSFIFFALVLFPKSGKPADELPRDKKLRNLIYRLCGVVMLVCVVWSAVRAVQREQIFWLEAIALEGFAISWLVKGRATVAAARVLNAGRHPMKLAAQVLDLTPRKQTKRPET